MGDIVLKKGSTWLRMADPRVAEPYYRGTRFDRTGIILDLESGGHRYIQPWQRRYDPYSHDAVSGPAEEFFTAECEPERGGLQGAESLTPSGECSLQPTPPRLSKSAGFVKVGVGLLRREDRPYDRFHLYEILDPGRLTVSLETGGAGLTFGVTQPQRSENGRSRSRSLPAGPEPTSATFRHILDGYYDYVKTVEIPAEGRLRLTHALTNAGTDPLDGHVYCHNFFILDGAPTGRATRFTFPWRPTGDWRAPYDSVRLSDDGIVFDRDLAPDETVFMGNLRLPAAGEGYRFKLQNLDNGLAVEAACDRPMEYAVFWSNADVSCLEPYIPFHIAPGQTFRWTLDYRFQ